MPRPSQRTRSKKIRLLRLPGGRRETHHKRKRIGLSHCTYCGRALSGVPRVTPSKLRKLPASQRRPSRRYGGELCHNCLRDLLKVETRGI